MSWSSVKTNKILGLLLDAADKAMPQTRASAEMNEKKRMLRPGLEYRLAPVWLSYEQNYFFCAQGGLLGSGVFPASRQKLIKINNKYNIIIIL